MSVTVSNCATPPPLPGGGPTPSPVQVPLAAGGPNGAPTGQSPMQVPLGNSAVQGASGGGQLVQPAAAPAPAPTSTSVPIASAPVTAGGPTELQVLLPALQQVAASLDAVAAALQAQVGASNVAGAQGGGEVAPGENPAASGRGGASGCGMAGCGGASDAASGGGSVTQSPRQGALAPPAPQAPKPAGAGAGTLDGADLKVKGKAMDDKQRANLQAVLRVGKEMGASKKVLETAVSTVIQESTARNDSSVDGKDLDSLGLFQQRPSAGWGKREQIAKPEYAARKFFEKAIPNDAKKPDQPKTLLAQSVQISAFPNAYAQWDRESEQIVADFLG